MATFFSFVEIFWSVSPLKSPSGTWQQLWATLSEQHYTGLTERERERCEKGETKGRGEGATSKRSTWQLDWSQTASALNLHFVNHILVLAPSKDTPMRYCSLCDSHAECVHTCMHGLKCTSTFDATGRLRVVQKLKENFVPSVLAEHWSFKWLLALVTTNFNTLQKITKQYVCSLNWTITACISSDSELLTTGWHTCVWHKTHNRRIFEMPQLASKLAKLFRFYISVLRIKRRNQLKQSTFL